MNSQGPCVFYLSTSIVDIAAVFFFFMSRTYTHRRLTCYELLVISYSVKEILLWMKTLLFKKKKKKNRMRLSDLLRWYINLSVWSYATLYLTGLARTSLIGPRSFAHGFDFLSRNAYNVRFIEVLVDVDVLTHLVQPSLHLVVTMNLYRPNANYIIFYY